MTSSPMGSPFSSPCIGNNPSVLSRRQLVPISEVMTRCDSSKGLQIVPSPSPRAGGVMPWSHLWMTTRGHIAPVRLSTGERTSQKTWKASPMANPGEHQASTLTSPTLCPSRTSALQPTHPQQHPEKVELGKREQAQEKCSSSPPQLWLAFQRRARRADEIFYGINRKTRSHLAEAT